MAHDVSEATVIMARCKQSRNPFGMRVERRSDGIWYFNWAFILAEKSARNEGYSNSTISGNMALDPEYPGCPYCGSGGWVSCGSCGKLTCSGDESYFTCAWCGNSGEVVREERFDLRGGGY